VFGHSPARESTLRHAHGLKLINVDAGMFELYGGHRVYLEITLLLTRIGRGMSISPAGCGTQAPTLRLLAGAVGCSADLPQTIPSVRFA